MREVAPGIGVVPVRTPTLPPATHTNTYVVGSGSLTVFDPASPWDDQQALLAAALDARIADGERLERIVLTHHHADHVSGAEALRARYPGTPISAHPETHRLLPNIDIDETWEDGVTRDCGGRKLQAHHTPGHAPGHLVFHDLDSGAVIAGDMVAGIGTILISPVDGDLGQYLDSLDALRRIAPSVLLPAHGEPLVQADAILGFYIAHRHQRSDQIRQALDTQGACTPLDLVPHVYPDLPVQTRPVAAAQILSHLRWLRGEGLVRDGHEAGWSLVSR